MSNVMPHTRVRITAETHARSNYAAQHLAAAQHFQVLLAGAEGSPSATKENLPPPEYLHCWHATIVFSVMALEANAYDLMTAADRGEQTPLAGIAFTRKDHWKPLLDRYSLIHHHVLGKKLDMANTTVEAAQALILLRNEVTHYKTEWRDRAVVSSHLEGLLRSRFTLNPFRCGDIFFPDQCISADSAKWAVATAHEFMRVFATSTGVRLNVSDVA